MKVKEDEKESVIDMEIHPVADMMQSSNGENVTNVEYNVESESYIKKHSHTVVDVSPNRKMIGGEGCHNSEETKDEKKLPADTEINPVHLEIEQNKNDGKNSCIGKKDMKGDKKMEISDVKLHPVNEMANNEKDNELSTVPVQADSEIHFLLSGSPKKKEKT